MLITTRYNKNVPDDWNRLRASIAERKLKVHNKDIVIIIIITIMIRSAIPNKIRSFFNIVIIINLIINTLMINIITILTLLIKMITLKVAAAMLSTCVFCQ